MLWILAPIALAAFVYYIIIKPHQYWREKDVKHGKPTFLFGENLGLAFKYESFMDMSLRVYNMFPGERYSGFYQFLTPWLAIRDPELLKQITVKDFDHFLDHRTFITEEQDPLFGKNLVSLKGQRWREMRATLSPSFTSSKMKTMFHLMSEVAENFVKHFQKQPGNIVEVELKDIFTRYTNDVIATTAFGIKVDSLAEPNNEFYLKGIDATNFKSFGRNIRIMGNFMMPKVFKFFKIGLFDRETSDYFRNVITSTIRTREEKGIVRHDMLNLLIQARKGVQSKDENGVIDTGFATVQESDIGKPKIQTELTDDDITAQALIFFFAGFDAVSTALSFMAYELGVNQDIQDKLRKEIKETLDECNGTLTYETVMKMKYLDMVLSESLRKWPNAVGTDRLSTKPFTIEPKLPGEKPLHLPTGSIVFLPIVGFHRDPQYYPDPEKFDPERFSEENKSKINPYTYFPFGLGPRNCIGNRFAILETKVLMFHLLNNFRIVPTKKSKIPVKISACAINVTVDGGLWFGLEKLT